jgi:hypothetical protein
MRRMSGAPASRCSPSATDTSARAPLGEAPFRLLQSALQAAPSGSAQAKPRRCRFRPFPELCRHPSLSPAADPGREWLVVQADLGELVDHWMLLDDRCDLVADKRGPRDSAPP